MSFLASFALLGLIVTGVIGAALPSNVRRSGTNSEQITYIMPIWEGSLATDNRNSDLAVLLNITTLLGSGTYIKIGWSFSSWALSRDILSSTSDYGFDPTNLNYMLSIAVDAGIPILVHMNDGRWADCCTPNSSGGWGDTLLEHIAGQANTTMQNAAGGSLFGVNGGGNYFSLSRLNTFYRQYKQRNVAAAAKVIATWAASNPSLFVGVSLDSETIYPGTNADFNPLAIQEWAQWLQNTGIYGPGGDYFGAGRVPSFASINDLNSAMGTSFASWASLSPPTSVTPGNTFTEEWERWRVMMILHAVSDETYWIEQAGIDRTLVFGHQTPRLDDYGFSDSLDTETAANGAGGVTYYGWNALTYGKVDNSMRGNGKNNWGNFELNPLSSDQSVNYANLVALQKDGIKVVCPNSWETEAVKDQYAIFDSPNYGNAFGNAIAQFVKDYENTPRTIQPPAWNPGNKVYDLYDQFSTAQSSGPDNHLEGNGSVGSVIRKSVYSAVGGVIQYKITLPSVSSGQTLNFWTSLGIKDGAGSGGETQFNATITDSKGATTGLYGDGLHFQQTYWLWKRWVPMMADITPWAGSTITLTLTTTGVSTWGWTTWGAPAVYISNYTTSTTSSGAVIEGNNLALGKSVSTTSTDGPTNEWAPSYLVDGQVDGGAANNGGRIGWSSISHSSPSFSTPESLVIDLGSTHSISRVVLHPRSDLSTAAGTGFPSAFAIQGSTDGTTFTNLVVETAYPTDMVLAGHAQIFDFVSASARYVRVSVSVGSGVGGESGWRVQLGEVMIF